jgi:hypothetical protein
VAATDVVGTTSQCLHKQRMKQKKKHYYVQFGNQLCEWYNE